MRAHVRCNEKKMHHNIRQGTCIFAFGGKGRKPLVILIYFSVFYIATTARICSKGVLLLEYGLT